MPARFSIAQTWIVMPLAMTCHLPGLSRRAFARGLTATSAAGFLAVAAPSLAQSAPVFDPRQFGAVGDGRTDDTRALQRAADAARAANGVVSIPDGLTFGISGYVHIRDGVRAVAGSGTIRILR